MATVSDGSSSFKKVPSVAVMIPAPIRTTSGLSELLMLGMEVFSSNEIERVWIRGRGARDGEDELLRPRSAIRFAEGDRGLGRQNHIGATPGLVVDEPPA